MSESKTKGLPDDDERDDSSSRNSPRDARDPSEPPVGFFHIYKRGQGYWTRLSTALAALGLLLLVGIYLYRTIPAHIDLSSATRTQTEAAELARRISLGIAAAFVIGGGLLVWKFMNAPKGADFLITTDQEMGRVNWASKKELFGSTRVVIIFLIFIASFLFLADIAFGWFFHVIGVLLRGPFG